MIRVIDATLRRVYGIAEFETAADGLLRIQPRRATAAFTLSDGTRIRPGDGVLDLHIWNEHFPPRPPKIDFRWAVRVQRQTLFTMHRLAIHLEENSDLDRVRALRMIPALAPRSGESSSSLLSIGGFELSATATARPNPILGSLDCLWAWLLTWTYDPGALSGWHFVRTRQEFWISRSRFFELYRDPLTLRRRGPIRR